MNQIEQNRDTTDKNVQCLAFLSQAACQPLYFDDMRRPKIVVYLSREQELAIAKQASKENRSKRLFAINAFEFYFRSVGEPWPVSEQDKRERK